MTESTQESWSQDQEEGWWVAPNTTFKKNGQEQKFNPTNDEHFRLFTKAHSFEDNLSSAVANNLGYSYARLKEYTKAKKGFEKALELAENEPLPQKYIKNNLTKVQGLIRPINRGTPPMHELRPDDEEPSSPGGI